MLKMLGPIFNGWVPQNLNCFFANDTTTNPRCRKGQIMTTTHPKHAKELGAIFSWFAKHSAVAMGHPWAFTLALLAIVAWGGTGPAFHYSDTWQLVINTGTTIVTFLMVFLIQHTQNRDSSAIQLKLDELIRSTQGAHNTLLDLEELSQEELNKFLQTYQKLADRGRRLVREGKTDIGTPDVRKP
jgi:low affinity Fe/Cu permease